MMYSINLSSVFITFLPFFARQTDGSIFTISDDRVRSLDITPTLGRGYSIMTNQYHSTCLKVDQTTVPSFNYDYFFTDFTQSFDAEADLEGQLSTSFGFGAIRAEITGNGSFTSKTRTTSHVVTSTMRIERYYSSVAEEASPLAPDAALLLAAEDYVGFFKACGPNYVRSIRRAQEVTAIFKYNTSSREIAGQFSSGLKMGGFGSDRSRRSTGKAKFNAINSSMTIKILGYGMGLTQEGSETMVATTLEEYNQVMQFSFRSMTKHKDAAHIGMIYGIEVTPWVHNTGFQANAKLQDADVITPLPRSLIPKAHLISDSTVTTGYTAETRDTYTCKGGEGFTIDKFGYCCEFEHLYDYATGDFDFETPEERVCKPSRSLDKNLIKDNMSNNGEFVARMDSALRYKLTQIGVAEKCISAANAIPLEFEFTYLNQQDSVKYDRVLTVTPTLFDLKRSLDPFGDYTFIKFLAKELDEWIEQFYSPCLAALYGANVGTTPDVDVSYFMASPWHAHDECLHLSCLTPNLRWDRNEGGCIPGIMTGSGSPGYVDGEDSQCAKSNENREDAAQTTEQCKYKQNDLRDYHTRATTCWNSLSAIGTSQVDYFISNFCNPQLTRNVMDAATETVQRDAANANCAAA